MLSVLDLKQMKNATQVLVSLIDGYTTEETLTGYRWVKYRVIFIQAEHIKETHIDSISEKLIMNPFKNIQ